MPSEIRDPVDALRGKARQIRLVCTDVDGVLTDGGMYYSEGGEELKKFNTRDGMGVAHLHSAGIEVAMITSENTELVARRAAKLKIKYLFQGVRDKQKVVEGLINELQLSWPSVAYIGDDVNDLPVIRSVGLTAAVSDAMQIVRDAVDYVCERAGGCGAFREFAELILSSQSQAAK